MNVYHRSLPLAFHAPKAAEPIPWRAPGGEDLLIQSALDRRVVSMNFVHRLALGDRSVRVAAPLIGGDDHTYVALQADAYPERDADETLVIEAIAAAGLVARKISREEVEREPLATTARVIWRQRHVGVDPGMRLGLLAAFAFDTSMSVHELCGRVPGPRDPVLAIMALACAGELHLDLAHGFDHSTTVWGPR